MKTTNHYKAIETMRKLSADNVPFSFSFLTCNLSTGESNGVRTVKRAILRTGLSREKGIKSQSLIGYVDLDTGNNRWFYLPLLLTFNKFEIKCLK